MNVEITEQQLDKLKVIIQNIIDSELNSLREQSEEWGLGEMDELHELDSIDKIVIDRVVPYTKIKVYVNLYKNSDREDFDMVLSELRYQLEQWVPNSVLLLNEIIDKESSVDV